MKFISSTCRELILLKVVLESFSDLLEHQYNDATNFTLSTEEVKPLGVLDLK